VTKRNLPLSPTRDQGDVAVSDTVLKLIYVAGLVAQIIIRAPFNRKRRRERVAVTRADWREGVVLAVFFLGMFVLPVLYVTTPWLSFANYRLPDWAAGPGVGLVAGALYLFWRSHVDLGRNWSPTLELREGHTLVSGGIYRHIRHPMYASQWLFAFAQPLLLQNWIAGLSGLICFLPFYAVRVPREERIMLDSFGDEYRAYLRRTGRILPRLRP
jgi:protein-S-isoprenylcysteine O-methyltransferase Ste14